MILKEIRVFFVWLCKLLCFLQESYYDSQGSRVLELWV